MLLGRLDIYKKKDSTTAVFEENKLCKKMRISRHLLICNKSAQIHKYIKQTRLTYNCAHLRSTKESLTFEFGTWLVEDGTGRYLVVLGQ